MKMNAIWQPYIIKTRQVSTGPTQTFKTFADQKHGQKERRELAGRIFRPHRTKHLRRSKDNVHAFYKLCDAIADELTSHLVVYREAHAAFVAGCAGYSEAFS